MEQTQELESYYSQQKLREADQLKPDWQCWIVDIEPGEYEKPLHYIDEDLTETRALTVYRNADGSWQYDYQGNQETTAPGADTDLDTLVLYRLVSS